MLAQENEAKEGRRGILFQENSADFWMNLPKFSPVSFGLHLAKSLHFLGRVSKRLFKSMESVTPAFIKANLYRPPKDSHKGQNGKLTIVGGSKLFHGASLWALKVASRMVDMVYYASVPENLELVKDLSKEVYDFIAVPQGKEAEYIAESDAVLIGPGLVRGSKEYTGTGESGEGTKALTLELFGRFPEKKWVIDAGSLQVISPEVLKSLSQVAITPHWKEFTELFQIPEKDPVSLKSLKDRVFLVQQKAQEYGCTIVLKGKTDIICSEKGEFLINETGNEGMTKGGTGDVLAGLIAALACKNDLFVAAAVGAYMNGLAGDELYQTVGPYFNASDLCDQVPQTLYQLLQ